jgi:Serine dehydrogenase proteinase
LPNSKKTFRDLLSEKARDLANTIGEVAEADILLFNSRVSRASHDKLLNILKTRRRRPNVFLLLFSEGGDPDAAYKISRTLQSMYQKFTCALPGYSKSAATIILIGAHDLVIGDDGEMGPLDVQMSKKDTLQDYESGLTVLNALTALHQKAYLAWEYFFLQIEESSKGSITVKTASHAASELTTGLFAPVYGQIDPLQIGEATRAMAIGGEYGERLNKNSQNLRTDALNKLMSEYPDHGFVIDRTEAKTLFARVRQPTNDEESFFQEIETFCDVEAGRKFGIVALLNEEAQAKGEENADTGAQPKENVGSDGTTA